MSLFKICTKTGVICLEGLAIIFGLLVLLGGLLIWRLGEGPIDISFVKNHVQQALRNEETGYYAEIETIGVVWPDFKGPAMLHLENVAVMQHDNQLVSVENADLGLSVPALLKGKIKPVLLRMGGPSLHLIRSEGNQITLGLAEEISTIQSGAVEGKGAFMEIIDDLSQPIEQMDDASPFSRLKMIEISKARMVVEDHVLGMTWFVPGLDLTIGKAENGLAASAGVRLPGGRDGASHIQFNIAYDRIDKKIMAGAYVQDLNPAMFVGKLENLEFLDGHQLFLNGDVNAVLDSEFNIESASLELFSSMGSLNLEGVYDDPFVFNKLDIDLAYEVQPDDLSHVVSLKRLGIEAGGVAVYVQSKAKIDLEEGIIDAPVMITLPDIPQDHIKPLWPDVLRGEGAETWLTKKLQGGNIHDGAVNFNVEAVQTDDDWDVSIGEIKANFKVSGTTVHYRDPLFPAEDIYGSGRYDGTSDNLVFDIEKGKLGLLDIKKGVVDIADVSSAKDGVANVSLDLSGGLKNVFDYIAEEPIGMKGDSIGLNTAKIEGHADFTASVVFPTLRDLPKELVKVKVNGTLRDVVLPDVVKDMDLTGGPLALSVADGRAALSGSAKLETRPIKFDWEQFLDSSDKPYSSRVNANLRVDRGMRLRLRVDLDDWIDGTVDSKITYTEFNDDRTEIAIKGNINDAVLKIDPFDYQKKEGVEGNVSALAKFKGGALQSISSLNVVTPELTSDGAVLNFSSVKGADFLSSGQFPNFKLGESDLSIEFERDLNEKMMLKVQGAFLDAQPFLTDQNDKGNYSGPAVSASVDVERMRTHPARLVEKTKIYMDMDDQGTVSQFEMDAIAGKGAIYLRLKPNDQGRMAIRLEADDAGAALQAFDMYENIRGGKLVLQGEAVSMEDPSFLRGNLEITKFHVVNAPILAKLVNTLSLGGITQLLGNDGISFSKLAANFDWKRRNEGDLYQVKDGRTSGSSLGLTFAGKIDKAGNKIDINGTVVPASALNTLVSNIPIVGDLLAGGRGGAVFAATYSISGPVKTPSVMVNPLAALTPGILRRIFFEE